MPPEREASSTHAAFVLTDMAGPTRRAGASAWLATALLLGLLASLPSLFNDPVYDDEVLIFSNPLVMQPGHLLENLTRDYFHSTSGTLMGYYRPATKLLFIVQVRLFGTAVPAYHAVSIAALLWSVVAGFRLARLLGHSAPLVGIACVLYATHPGHASAVAVITSQSDVFVVCCMLEGLCAFVRFRQGRRRSQLWLAVMFQALALGFKESAATLPVICAALILAEAGGSLRALVRARELGWLVAPLVVYAGVRVALNVLPISGVSQELWPELAARAKILVGSVARSLCPIGWVPQLHVSRPSVQLASIAGWLLAASLTLAAAYVLARRHAGVRPGLALLLIPLAPIVLGASLAHTTDDPNALVIPDRWLMLSSLGGSLLIAALCTGLAELTQRPLLRRLGGVLVLLLAGLQVLLAAEANASYRDENARALYIASLYRANGQSPPIELGLVADALAAEAAEDWPNAAKAHRALSARKPDDLLRRYNLARALDRAGHVPEAAYEAFIAFHGASPDGKLQLSPNDSFARRKAERAFLLASILERAGDHRGALAYSQICLELRPDHAGARALRTALLASPPRAQGVPER